jgi:GntR family transcriptional regulator
MTAKLNLSKNDSPKTSAAALQEVFSVDEKSDLPIWVQLRNRISYLIRTGYFQPGEQVPSVRSLSAAAGINYSTVTRAYKELEQIGLIESIRGRGMYVKNMVVDREDPAIPVDTMQESCIKSYRSLGMSFEDIRTRVNGIIDKAEGVRADSSERNVIYYEKAE